MKVSVENWKVSKLIKLRDQINPQPKYQRGEVWKDSKKRLLMDSMLRGIDIPKIYLRLLKKSAFKYEVADGQQRITAILKFVDDNLLLEDKTDNGVNLSRIKDHKVGGLKFTDLPIDLKHYLENFSLTIAIVEETADTEIRTLFGRLQLGSQLNPAEKRNAIISPVSDHIDSFALNHKFFTGSKISVERYKHQDYLAHVFTLMKHGNRGDLKAIALEGLYLDKTITVSAQDLKSIDKILDALHEIDHAGGVRIVNKFAFIDFFWFLYQRKWKSINAKKISELFSSFEKQRLKYSINPKELIEKEKSTSADRQLYDYIVAFNYSGSAKESIEIRNQVFEKMFSKFTI